MNDCVIFRRIHSLQTLGLVSVLPLCFHIKGNLVVIKLNTICIVLVRTKARQFNYMNSLVNCHSQKLVCVPLGAVGGPLTLPNTPLGVSATYIHQRVCLGDALNCSPGLGFSVGD